MSSPLRVDVFAEDAAHEALLSALTRRIAREEGISTALRVRIATGGVGRVLQELKAYTEVVRRGGVAMPDVLVTAIDSNCKKFAGKARQVREHVPDELWDRTVLACPEPHVEKWYLSDPDALVDVFGVRPTVPRTKCERGRYKAALVRAVRDGGGVPTLGGIEFANEIAESIDLYRAGQSDRSLQQFVTGFRKALRLASSQ